MLDMKFKLPCGCLFDHGYFRYDEEVPNLAPRLTLVCKTHLEEGRKIPVTEESVMAFMKKILTPK